MIQGTASDIQTLHGLQSLKTSLKTKLLGGKVQPPPLEKDFDVVDLADKVSKDKRKKSKTSQKPKVSYDKTVKELNIIQQGLGTGNDSDEEEDANVSALQLSSKQCVNVDAWEKFNLPPPMETALSELGFSKPTKIQVDDLVYATRHI